MVPPGRGTRRATQRGSWSDMLRLLGLWRVHLPGKLFFAADGSFFCLAAKRPPAELMQTKPNWGSKASPAKPRNFCTSARLEAGAGDRNLILVVMLIPSGERLGPADRGIGHLYYTASPPPGAPYSEGRGRGTATGTRFRR